MPLHEYRCRSCENLFEALVRSPERPCCPSCHGYELERLLSAFAFSSETSRQSNLKAARERHSKVQRDKELAYQEQIRDHH